MWSIFYNVFRLERDFIENKLYNHILMCWCAVKKFRTNCKCWFCNYVKSHKWIQYCSKTYLLGKMYDRFLKIFFVHMHRFFCQFILHNRPISSVQLHLKKTPTNRFILLSFRCTLKYTTHYQISGWYFSQVFLVLLLIY